MSAYIDSIQRPPRTLLEREQKLLLKVTGQHRDGFRDHVIFSLALGTGLREHEIVGLNVGDIYDDQGKPRRRVQLQVFERSNPDREYQQVFLSTRFGIKLEKYNSWNRRRNELLEPKSPLFMSRKNNRLSKRQIRYLFGVWQERAGFDQHFGFHSMRHSACSQIHRRCGDLRITQKFARHKSSRSTEIYTHPSDENMFAVVEGVGW